MRVDTHEDSPDLPATVAATNAKGCEDADTWPETEGPDGEGNGEGSEDISGDLVMR